MHQDYAARPVNGRLRRPRRGPARTPETAQKPSSVGRRASCREDADMHTCTSFATDAHRLRYRKTPEVQPVARTGLRSVSPVSTLRFLAFGARRVRTLVDFARRRTQKRV